LIGLGGIEIFLVLCNYKKKPKKAVGMCKALTSALAALLTLGNACGLLR